jgi:hypothetical protein
MADDFPAGYVILQCPVGAEAGLVSHGDQSFHCWREDHRDSGSRWLVAVPQEVARHLTWNAGFTFYSPDK